MPEPITELLEAMRALRRRAEVLNQTVVEDHRPYLNQHFSGTFFRLPSRPPKAEKGVNVTPTCTAFMSLALCYGFDKVYSGIETKTPVQIILDAENQVLAALWDTGGLRANNGFTTTLVLRSAGHLYRAGYLTEANLSSLKRGVEDPITEKSRDGMDVALPAYRQYAHQDLRSIGKAMIRGVPASLSVQDYPASTTIAYWLLDAIWLLKGTLEDTDSTAAMHHDVVGGLVQWCTTEFFRQVTTVAANDHTRMDPIALAMAACVCRLLRRLANSSDLLRSKLSQAKNFPTDVQLLSAIYQFLNKQNSAGVWEKYFPIFHYPGAGPNHCWHFEVLEAVLNEFPEILRQPATLRRIDKSLEWLKDNRLAWQGDNSTHFFGWNSGGDFDALQTGQPESWPTGVAHMFLRRLSDALSVQIRELVLLKYGDRAQLNPKVDDKDWKRNLDCTMPKFPKPRDTVKGLLDAEILKPIEAEIKSFRKAASLTDAEPLGPQFQTSKRRSALLFGPPGTSKTSLAEAVAKRLGWPFIELSPSDFLKGGLEGIYDRVNEVFDDLMDLFAVVILFDEMDALVQSREDVPPVGPATNDKYGSQHPTNPQVTTATPQLDVTQTFLTTSMLPKILKLRKRGRTIFFMATNYQVRFDPAIKRPGRFDLLVRMGPPSSAEKVRGIREEAKGWLDGESNEDTMWIKSNLPAWIESDPDLSAKLERFLYGEMTALFDHFRRLDSKNERLRVGLESSKAEGFKAVVDDWYGKTITLHKDSRAWDQFSDVDERAIAIQ